jgi:hypothetical protein
VVEALWALGVPEPKKRLKRPDGGLGGCGGKGAENSSQRRRFLPPFHRYRDLCGDPGDFTDIQNRHCYPTWCGRDHYPVHTVAVDGDLVPWLLLYAPPHMEMMTFHGRSLLRLLPPSVRQFGTRLEHAGFIVINALARSMVNGGSRVSLMYGCTSTYYTVRTGPCVAIVIGRYVYIVTWPASSRK